MKNRKREKQTINSNYRVYVVRTSPKICTFCPVSSNKKSVLLISCVFRTCFSLTADGTLKKTRPTAMCSDANTAKEEKIVTFSREIQRTIIMTCHQDVSAPLRHLVFVLFLNSKPACLSLLCYVLCAQQQSCAIFMIA